jgi:hypothetical protein
MPTIGGLKRVLEKLGAGPHGSESVHWISLREVAHHIYLDLSLIHGQEPVIYVCGRPHVLRLTDKPLENVECAISYHRWYPLMLSRATGITTAVVESMEVTLKNDACKDAKKSGGRLLLHDEVERTGHFDIIPQWEVIKGHNDILTPRDIYDIVAGEGYKVSIHVWLCSSRCSQVSKGFISTNSHC